jgi:hypothetical protein
MRGPPSVQYSGVGPYLIALRVEMVLDGTYSPAAELVRRLYDVEPVVEHLVVKLFVAPERPLFFAILPIIGGKHRVKLNDYFRLGHETVPL